MSASTLTSMEKPIRDALKAARRLGAESAKIGFTRERIDAITFEAGRLKEVGLRERDGYSIHVLAGGRVGVSGGNRIDRLEAMTERAVQLTKVGSVAHFERWPGPADHASVAAYCDSLESFTRERLIEGCERIADRLRRQDSELHLECSGSRTRSDQLLMSSEGLEHQIRKGHWSLGGMAQRTRGTDMLFAHESRYWSSDNEFFSPDEVAAAVEEDLRRAEKTVAPPKGQTAVILDPRMLSAFLSACVFSGTSGRAVAKGDSPLRGRLGERILDPALTIVDDPHIDFCPTSREVDADGVPTRRQTIFENGVLKRFLYDLDSAGLAGAEPTGNSGCRPCRAVVTPGETSLDDLIAGLDDGVLVKSLLGFGQSNVANGDFSANVALGFRVKGGEIVGRIKDCMISGNVYDVLKDDVTVSSDADFTGHTPFALVKGAALSSK